jgi:protein-tyrosine phosphatase
MKRLLVCAAALILAAQPAQAAIAQAAPAEQSTHQRLLPLQGVQNARDIGGYRTTDGRTVKWDVIYRTAELSHLTAQDKALLEARGLRSVHDLRSVDERRDQPTVWTGEGAPAVTAFDYSMDLSGFAALFQGDVTADRARDVFAASYPEMLKMQRPQQRALFADLLKGEGVVLYHCSAGKDRTGIATALILSALGVPRETIVADYELSNLYYRPDPTGADASDNPQAAAFMQLPEDVRAIFMGVDARYLQAVFDLIDRDYGSVEIYLDRELQVDAADIQRLRLLYTV